MDNSVPLRCCCLAGLCEEQALRDCADPWNREFTGIPSDKISTQGCLWQWSVITNQSHKSIASQGTDIYPVIKGTWRFRNKWKERSVTEVEFTTINDINITWLPLLSLNEVSIDSKREGEDGGHRVMWCQRVWIKLQELYG